ncbi:S-adenosylmethionine decarboxylase family protein [Desertivirga arenae]|uniref:S-adenosylmethionine decarboxylase family protein n=1 Tax=Desertivirga arenae TaxID=2810309 RepID=UPI001A9618F8|nr:S-adenosylmethionine decarboxylase [Pedobacter sp. SYSU D00823]
MEYNPGLHILAEFKTERADLLCSSAASRELFEKLITRFELSSVGEVYHDFEQGGFTAVICLTESHLSIHTWPEFKLATFDIFLSNFRKDNTEKVRAIYKEVLAFFEGSELQKTELRR